jgi:hypothetical protein
MKLNSEFLREFGQWFDVDLIPIDDRQAMIDDALGIADTMAATPGAERLQEELDEILKTWRPEDIRQFIGATNTDWFADEKMQALLRDLLTTIRDRLKQLRAKH